VKVGYKVCSEGIEVEVADELEQVGFLLTQDGLVPVLKEIAVAPVAPVEIGRISGEESPHDDV